MRHISIAFALVFVLLSSASSAIELRPDGSWVPEVDFKFGDASFDETMMWVSGFSYALTALVASDSKSGRAPRFCPPEPGFIESRVVLTIFNKQFKGKDVSADEATGAIWLGLEAAYPCPPRSEG